MVCQKLQLPSILHLTLCNDVCYFQNHRCYITALYRTTSPPVAEENQTRLFNCISHARISSFSEVFGSFFLARDFSGYRKKHARRKKTINHTKFMHTWLENMSKNIENNDFLKCKLYVEAAKIVWADLEIENCNWLKTVDFFRHTKTIFRCKKGEGGGERGYVFAALIAAIFFHTTNYGLIFNNFVYSLRVTEYRQSITQTNAAANCRDWPGTLHSLRLIFLIGRCLRNFIPSLYFNNRNFIIYSTVPTYAQFISIDLIQDSICLLRRKAIQWTFLTNFRTFRQVIICIVLFLSGGNWCFGFTIIKLKNILWFKNFRRINIHVFDEPIRERHIWQARDGNKGLRKSRLKQYGTASCAN